MYPSRNIPTFFLCMVAAVIIFSTSTGIAAATTQLTKGETILHETYRSNRAKLENSSFGLPLFLESSEQEDRVHVDVYGVFDYSFSSVINVLKVPANWCDIVSLHPNVKACTYDERPDTGLLTFYIGKKEYQSPEDSQAVIYRYRNIVQQKGYLDIILNSDEGPFGTKNHTMRFEALPLDNGTTFVHVSYEYSDSIALRLAGKIYFATLGRSKVGFTVTGADKSGQPVYIGGPRGAVERNAVRYYFAIQSFMNTLYTPEKSLFSIRSGQWFDLISRYKRQLYDLDRNDYLAYKTTEHKNQVTLQHRIIRGLP